MNIFFLSYSPDQCAKWMVDKHVVKMILESAQLLCTAHRVLDGNKFVDTTGKRKKTVYILEDQVKEIVLYSATHINHPSAVWVRESSYNYIWLYDHFCSLLDEYRHRYGKIHSCEKFKTILNQIPKNIPNQFQLTPVRCAMDKKFIISDDPIINYRNYYKKGKPHLFSWKNREKPPWIY